MIPNKQKIENLQANDTLSVYHGTDYETAYHFIQNGIDAKSEHSRKYPHAHESGKPLKVGLFITADLKVAESFGRVVLEFDVKGKDLYSTNAHTVDKIKKADDAVSRWYPNSFRPSVSSNLLTSESQALFLGFIAPREIKNVHVYDLKNHTWKQMNREQYLTEFKDSFGKDVSEHVVEPQEKITLDEFYKRVVEKEGGTIEDVKKAADFYLHRGKDHFIDAFKIYAPLTVLKRLANMAEKKSESFKTKLESRYRIKSDYESYRDKTWIHYSQHEEMKFNYKAKHSDPIGIYFFPEGFKTGGSWHAHPYKYTAKLKPEANVLDLAKMNTKEKALQLVEQLGAKPKAVEDVFPQEYEHHADKRKNYYIDRAWEWLTAHYTGRKAAFTKQIMNAGYDAIFDDTDSIFSGETQLIVLKPKMLTDIKQTRQGATGYKEVSKARDTILDLLKGYDGKVLYAEKPKSKKGYGNDPAYIESTIKFAHDEYTRTYEHDGKTHSYPAYKREILFTIHTGTESFGKSKRPATKINVSAQGMSDEYRKHFTGSHGAEYRPSGLECRLEDFNEKDIEPWLHKTIKMVWDDTAPGKEVERWNKQKLAWSETDKINDWSKENMPLFNANDTPSEYKVPLRNALDAIKDAMAQKIREETIDQEKLSTALEGLDTLETKVKEAGMAPDVLADALKEIQMVRDIAKEKTKEEVKSEADDDDEIGKGKHALTTDESGKFWGSEGAGGVFYAKDTKRFLLAFRSAYVNEPHTWGVWGGALDSGETPQEGMRREIEEETQFKGSYKLIPSFVYKKGNFKYHNFIIEVEKEFEPHLCWETEKADWFTLDAFPTPLHFGLKALLPYLKNSFKDQVTSKYRLLTTADVKLALKPIPISKITNLKTQTTKSKKAKAPKTPVVPQFAEGIGKGEKVGFSELSNTRKLVPFIQKELQLTNPFNFTSATWSRFTKAIAPKLLTALLLDMNVVPKAKKADFARYLTKKLRNLAQT